MQCAAFLNLPQRDVIEGRPSPASLSTTRPHVFGESGARRRTPIYILAPDLDAHLRDFMETGEKPGAENNSNYLGTGKPFSSV